MRQKTGDTARAIETAHEAFPLCFRHGLGFLAAEIFDALDADAHTLGLKREELLALGGALGRTVYWPVAFRALASVLVDDPTEEQAINDLLRIADQQLHQLREPAEAGRIYQFLATVAPDCPQKETIENGLAESECALAAASP
jgi:hypothetical protein